MPPAPRRIPEEPEVDRRKRKYREWTAEMGAGLEVELGLDEVIHCGCQTLPGYRLI
jgi:hypothetical protein